MLYKIVKKVDSNGFCPKHKVWWNNGTMNFLIDCVVDIDDPSNLKTIITKNIKTFSGAKSLGDWILSTNWLEPIYIDNDYLRTIKE
jgi:hypothetical protein